jgi:hypothetical protein
MLEVCASWLVVWVFVLLEFLNCVWYRLNADSCYPFVRRAAAEVREW